MPKCLLRIAIAILVPCLIADPSLAAALSHQQLMMGHFPDRLGKLSYQSAEDNFLSEALELAAAPFQIPLSRPTKRRFFHEVSNQTEINQSRIKDHPDYEYRKPLLAQTPLTRFAWLKFASYLTRGLRNSSYGEAFFTAISELLFLTAPPAIIGLLVRHSLDDPASLILVASAGIIIWIPYARLHSYIPYRLLEAGTYPRPLGWRGMMRTFLLSQLAVSVVLTAMYSSASLAAVMFGSVILLAALLDQSALRRGANSLDRLHWQYQRIERPTPLKLGSRGHVEIVIPEDVGSPFVAKVHEQLINDFGAASTVVTDFFNEDLAPIHRKLTDAGITFDEAEALEIGPGATIDEIVHILTNFPELRAIHVIMITSIQSRILNDLPRYMDTHPEIKTIVKIYFGTVLLLPESLKGKIRFVHLKRVLSQFSRNAARQAYLEIARIMDSNGVLYAKGADQPDPIRAFELIPKKNPFTVLPTLTKETHSNLFVLKEPKVRVDNPNPEPGMLYRRRPTLFLNFIPQIKNSSFWIDAWEYARLNFPFLLRIHARLQVIQHHIKESA